MRKTPTWKTITTTKSQMEGMESKEGTEIPKKERMAHVLKGDLRKVQER
jgi:hypothetical protein